MLKPSNCLPESVDQLLRLVWYEPFYHEACMFHEHPGSPPSKRREEREMGRVTLEAVKKKGIDLKNLQEGRQGSGMRKTPSACVGGRGVEKQGCRSALHHPSRVLATCISVFRPLPQKGI